MAIERIVPDLAVASTAVSIDFYTQVLGMRPVMDLGWIATVADPERPDRQISVMASEATAPVLPEVSIEVDDVDAAYRAAMAAGAPIVHPLTDEPWGVRRFFVRDPDGHVLNVLAHRRPDDDDEGEAG